MQSAQEPHKLSRLRSTKPSKRLLKMRSKSYRDSISKENIVNRLSLQIKLMREKANLTQAELAKKLGTRQSAIARLEDPSYGKYSLSMLNKISHIFDVNLWVEFSSYSSFLRKTQNLSSENLLPKSYLDEFSDDGEPYDAVELTFDKSAICVSNYITPINDEGIKKVTIPASSGCQSLFLN